MKSASADLAPQSDKSDAVGKNIRGPLKSMAVPQIHVSISGSVIAFYAAAVATLTGAVQLSNYLRDRARIKLRAQHDMVIIGGPIKEEGLTMIYVMNGGRRPVTITTVGAQRLFPHHPFVIPRCNPTLPYELTEGKSLIAIIPKSDLNFATIDYWETYDAVGNSYRLRVAPLHLRLVSNLRWRRYFAKQRKIVTKNSSSLKQ